MNVDITERSRYDVLLMLHYFGDHATFLFTFDSWVLLISTPLSHMSIKRPALRYHHTVYTIVSNPFVWAPRISLHECLKHPNKNYYPSLQADFQALLPIFKTGFQTSRYGPLCHELSIPSKAREEFTNFV